MSVELAWEAGFMPRASVRELRYETPGVLERVAGGETVVITNRGDAVAVLRPLTDAEREMMTLIEQGKLIPAHSGLAGSAGRVASIAPVPAEPGQASVDEALEDVRADRSW